MGEVEMEDTARAAEGDFDPSPALPELDCHQDVIASSISTVTTRRHCKVFCVSGVADLAIRGHPVFLLPNEHPAFLLLPVAQEFILQGLTGGQGLL